MKRIKRKVKRVFIPHSENDWQPHILKPRTLFILAVVLLLIKFLIFSWFVYFPKTSQFAVVTSSHLVELANQERNAAGLNSLQVNQLLVQAAEQKAQDMLNNNYFDHTSPNGITPWYWLDKNGYKYKAAGENLAKDFTESEFLHQAWMNSSSHRANILNNKYQDIGIAVIEGTINNKKTILAVQFFALSTKVPTKVGTTVEEKKPAPPITISNTNIELPSYAPTTAEAKAGKEASEDKEPSSLKGPLVFKQRGDSEKIVEKPKNILNTVTEKSENLVEKIYFAILGILILVLFLTIFINIRVQHPKLIFTSLIFIILIAAIVLFNDQEFLNRGIDII